VKCAPGAVVGDVDALLATRAGGDQRAVDIEHGLVEEVGGLLLSDLDPGLIEDVLGGLDVVGCETDLPLLCRKPVVAKSLRYG
jgi:hypothetical protein